MELMKFQVSILISLIALFIAACSTTPSNPNAPTVLEQHKNIAVEPETKHNMARLIKQKDNCLIEFTGNFATGKATEYWLFKNDQLISAFTRVDAQVEDQSTVFDPQDPEKIKNFHALKNNFKASNLKQCENI